MSKNQTTSSKTYPSQFEKVKAITDQLEAGIQALFESDKYKEYLKTLSKFHDYSLNNTILIALQKPDATLVAGYTAWQKQFGRQVQKGESGIRILAPTPYKKKMQVDKTDPVTGEILRNPDGTSEKETREVLMPAFKVVNVFDVSQTDGKPLPTIGVNELTGDVAQYEMFFEALKKSCPVPIGFEQIEGGAKGYFHTVENRIAIQEGMSQVQTIKTAIHEMTHQKLHSIDPDKNPNKKSDPTEPKLTRNQKEVEAESVAFTVCQHYGIDTGDYSFAYVAGWSHGKETPELKASLDRIRQAANEMITEIDGHMAELQHDYTWEHLTAEDVQNLQCIGSEYFRVSRMAEHTFTCEIAGDPVTLTYTTTHHDDGEGFVIHSEGKDIWDRMPTTELRKLESQLSSGVEMHRYLEQVEKAQTPEDIQDINWSIMEDENLFMTEDHRRQLYEAINAKEAALCALAPITEGRTTEEGSADPRSVLASLQDKKAEAKSDNTKGAKKNVPAKETHARKKEITR